MAALLGGGLCMGLSGWAIMRWWPRRAIDPIEANALYGGRMSLNDSLIVVGQTLLSNGVGASVGLEAGYTQIGSALASRLGRSFRVRRNDMRVLVGCGAAGAIAAAFNAPLTGAFYAFELVIGTYSLATLAPVVSAAIVAVVVERLLTPELYGFDIALPTTIAPVDYLPVLALGDAGGADGHRHHARRDADRGHLPPQPRADLAAPGDRRAGGRRGWRWSRRRCSPPAMRRCR